MTLDEIPTPALLLDMDVLEANLRRMAERTRELDVRLRPHVKTHKCVEIGRLELEGGAEGVTVATLEEARTFAAAGFEDLTWAFPVVPGRLAEARAVETELGARLRLLVDQPAAVRELKDFGHPFHVWLEVDCGYGRTGVDPEGTTMLELASALEDSAILRFDGILTHSGQAYRARSPGQAAAAAEEERRVMVAAAARLREAGTPVRAVSTGSTPALSRARDLTGVDEVRPGNYALYDRTQVHIGSCELEDVAVTVLATVVSTHADADRSVVDAGALALSVDPGPEDARATMGRIFGDYGRRELRDAHLVSLSQEHGIVRGTLPYGERVRILPNHSCLTVACHDRFHRIRGDTVEGSWRIHRER